MGLLGSLIRWICLAILGLLASVSVLYVSIFVWEDRCGFPSDDALRVLVPIVKFTETQELAASGRVGDIDAALRSPKPPHVIGLDYYRIVTSKTSAGYVVTIKPTGWCFCRRTYVLRDGGKRLEVVPDFLNRRRY